MSSSQDATSSSRRRQDNAFVRCLQQSMTPDKPSREYCDYLYRIWSSERRARRPQGSRSRTEAAFPTSRRTPGEENVATQDAAASPLISTHDAVRGTGVMSNTSQPISQGANINALRERDLLGLPPISSDFNQSYQLGRHRAPETGSSTAAFSSSEYASRIEEPTSFRNNNSEAQHPYSVYGNMGTHTIEAWIARSPWYITPSYPFANQLFLLRVRGPDGELSFPARHEPTSVISLFPTHLIVDLGWRFNERNSRREIYETRDVFVAECSTGSYRPRQFVRDIQISRGMGRRSPFLTKVGLMYPLPERSIGPRGEMPMDLEYQNAWNFGYIIVGTRLLAELESHSGIYDTGLV